MDTPPATTKFKNHRFPVEIVSHAVWLYFRFCLSFHDVEELLLERGVVVTYEAIRQVTAHLGRRLPHQERGSSERQERRRGIVANRCCTRRRQIL